MPSGIDGFRIFYVSGNSTRLSLPEGRKSSQILRVHIALAVYVLDGDLERPRTPESSSSLLDESPIGVLQSSASTEEPKVARYPTSLPWLADTMLGRGIVTSQLHEGHDELPQGSADHVQCTRI